MCRDGHFHGAFSLGLSLGEAVVYAYQAFELQLGEVNVDGLLLVAEVHHHYGTFLSVQLLHVLGYHIDFAFTLYHGSAYSQLVLVHGQQVGVGEEVQGRLAQGGHVATDEQG